MTKFDEWVKETQAEEEWEKYLPLLTVAEMEEEADDQEQEIAIPTHPSNRSRASLLTTVSPTSKKVLLNSKKKRVTKLHLL